MLPMPARQALARTVAATLLPVLLLAGCVTRGGDPTQPVPVAFHAAREPGNRLVVVLPGRGDDLASLERRGVAALVQASWPDAEVLTTGLTMPYYLEEQAVVRLHEEIVGPARRRGREVWLLGVSLGGTGALLYERAHPGAVAGLLLLSPYLGHEEVQDEIRAAGGLHGWSPGPEPELAVSNFQRELWRAPWRWTREPGRAANVWLSYGTRESFRIPGAYLAQALPAGNVHVLPGRHDWRLWSRATTTLLADADAADTARNLTRPAAARPAAASSCADNCPAVVPGDR